MLTKKLFGRSCMKRNNHQHFKLSNFIGLTIAGFINAFGVTVFLSPVKLYDSGISGTSMLLSQITPISLSIFLILLNFPLFLYGLKNRARFSRYIPFIPLRCTHSVHTLSLRISYLLMSASHPRLPVRTYFFVLYSAE